MPSPEVRYCTTEDGVRIAYCVEGEGPYLVVCPGFIESFSADHLVPEEGRFMSRLAASMRLVRLDMRGTGLSQRNVDDFSPNALVKDLEAVIRAARIKQCFMWASTLSGARAIQYAHAHQRQLLGLLLYGTFARARDVLSAEAVQGMAEFIRTNPDLAISTIIGSLENVPPETRSRLIETYRASANGDVVAKILLGGYDTTDVTSLLASLRVPALVIHRSGDTVIPFELGQQLASQLADASFLPLEGSVHPYTFGDSQAVLQAVEAFVVARLRRPATRPGRATARPTGSVATILWTDLVAHTEMMQRLGDEQGRVVLREHERITREVLKEHGGDEVKTMGDGFMASFGSVTKAVECAIALQRAFDTHNAGAEAPGHAPLNVRVGLNAGEPIAEEGDLFGASVILAARVAAQAGPGEILIPEPVRHLLAGKDFLFSDRGEVALKGFEDAVRLYEVRWRDA